MNTQLQFEINELRQQNLQHLLESVGVIMAALIIASLLPSLLIQFVYTDQAALMSGKPPFWLQNGSMIVFGLGVLYFVFVLVANALRSRTIGMLKRQLAMIGAEANLSASDLASQEKELASLEKMVDEALAADKQAEKSTKKRTRTAKK